MYMNDFKYILPKMVVGLFLLISAVPASAYAMETATWIPWFGANNGLDGVKSATKNIKKIDTVYLFTVEGNSDGTLRQRVDFSDKNWQKFIKIARDNKVEVIPTVAWFDGDQIQAILSDDTTRAAHVAEIVKMVNENNFDGVDIDYEQKNKESKDDFSAFIVDLKKALGTKILSCTLEARTPPDSLYKVIPEKIEYSNDYAVINKNCDRVPVMAYDQQRADLKLNDTRKGLPYEPVADKDWVKKVVELAIKDIDKDKILLGVPTYGRAWDVTVAPEWYRDYTRVASLNYPRVLYLSKKYKSKIGRTAGGEAVISYFPEDSEYKKLIKSTKVPKGTPKGYEAAAQALAYATKNNIEVQVRFVTWSDALAIKDKMDLAAKYKLRGTAIFKVDGEEDPKLWKLIK